MCLASKTHKAIFRGHPECFSSRRCPCGWRSQCDLDSLAAHEGRRYTLNTYPMYIGIGAGAFGLGMKIYEDGASS